MSAAASEAAPAIAGRTTSENPFTRGFWLGSVDPRPFALFRILFGLTLLHDLVDYGRDLPAFLTDSGILPRGAVHGIGTWSVFDLVGSVPAVAFLYAVGSLAVLAFTVGYRTRIATVVSWLFILSIHHRNYYLTDAGDDLARILLFYAMFADLGAAYSIDARRASKPALAIPAFGPRLLQLHIALLYFVAARLKVHFGWLHINVIYEVLQLDGFVRPLGHVLGAHPVICRVLTRSVLAMEFFFPFFALAPIQRKATRAIAVLLGLGVQLGIFFTLRMGVFTEVMLATEMLFLQPEWVDRAETWVGKRWALAASTRQSAVRAAPRWAFGVYALLAVQLAVAQWDNFAGHRFPLPSWLQDERSALDVVQPAGLFHVAYGIHRWTAPGELADGSRVDVLSVAAPLMQPRKPAISASRWNKFTFKEIEHPFRLAELGAYLCRAYDERAPGSSKLTDFTLIEDLYQPQAEGSGPTPPQHRELWHQTCAEQTVEGAPVAQGRGN